MTHGGQQSVRTYLVLWDNLTVLHGLVISVGGTTVYDGQQSVRYRGDYAAVRA